MANAAKKLSLTVKLTIILSVLAVVFLALSITSAVYSVNRTIEAIDSIGEVEYSGESKEKIDLAQSYFDKLDANIGLPEKITNADSLTDAKVEYVRLGIKRAYLAHKNGEDEALIKEYLTDARQSFDEYLTEADSEKLSNYADLTDLEEKYISDTESGGAPVNINPADGGEEIELC